MTVFICFFHLFVFNLSHRPFGEVVGLRFQDGLESGYCWRQLVNRIKLSYNESSEYLFESRRGERIGRSFVSQ